VLGLHPTFKTLSKFIPDPFFVHGHKSSNGLVDLARRKVKKRLDSGKQRDDILGKLIHARSGEGETLDGESFDGLVAEAVTLL
jgi:benzoate 4-monooxygenase